jgi:hypothetical protein
MIFASALRGPRGEGRRQATADIVAQRPGTDKAAVEGARKGCDGEGKHKESMIKAGEAIAAISKALQ